jgi:putative ABC transport system permease protein
MLLHLMKLIWNRKRSNALLIIEIFLAFLVVFAVAAGAIQTLDLYLRPLGFDWHEVWSIQALRPDSGFFESYSAEDAATIRRLILEMESLQPVLTVAAATHSPYRFMTSHNQVIV